jgi:hypothetical protein
MAEVKTSSPLSCHHAGEHRAMTRALAAHCAVTVRRACVEGAPAVHMCVGWPKAAELGHVTGPWSSRPLWHWAPLWPRCTVQFANFQIYSNEIQIHFGFN